jgi:glycosyltransferase involved in cell wall biosynthesis
LKSGSLIQKENNKKIKNCNPEVSIIIPVYNVEKWIFKTIESIKNQIYQNYEVIVIDDGSTDNTKNIISKYTDDPRFKIKMRDHHGVSSARNYGLKVSIGKYVTYIDGDDYWDINFLSSMINQIEKSDSDLVVCEFRIYDENKRLFRNVVPKIETFNDKMLHH